LQGNENHLQKINSKIDGFVQVVDLIIEENNPYKQIKQTIQQLLNNKIDYNNIAILTYTNEDVLNLYLYLKDNFPDIKITTEMTSRLIIEPNIKALVNYIKYFYFNQNIYKANFNTIMGYEFLAPLDKEFDIFNTNLPQLIKNIATYYNLLDQNMIKLIEVCKTYKNIVDFIYNIDNLEEIRVDKDSFGIQILTVFKAKGLEFDTVLVLDRIKKKNSDKLPLLFEYENLKLKNIFIKNTHREHFDINYQEAKTKEKILSLEDDLNILYVALTRAKNNLIVFKKNSSSAFDILGDSCNIQQIGKLYIQNKQQNISKQTINIDYTPLSLGQQDRLKKDEDTNDINIKYQYFGIATHYCLEMMKSFDIGSLNKSIDITKNKYCHILEDDIFDDIYKRVKILINNNEFLQLTKDGQIFKEQALSYNNQIKILDLLIKQGDNYIICDYKTTTSYKLEHKNQINLYKKAVQNITNSQNIKSFLIYLEKDNTRLIQV